MDFLIADTFTSSLAKLTGEEQKAVKTSAFDLQLNPGSPGLQLHRLSKARDKHFWSVRVNRDIRIIVHKTDSSFLLCYVDHHNKAYDWAESRKLEQHPSTGAAQLVQIRETVKEIWTHAAQLSATKVRAPKPLFAKLSNEELLSFGVPQEWINDVLAADEDSFLALSQHLPAEATEALLQMATGNRPEIQKISAKDGDFFRHPDSQRRFRLVTSVIELQRALDFPWEKWTVFLHPSQRALVERKFKGPVRVSGSAGTGKTIVALHRTVFLARQNPNSKILLTTFSDALASSLRRKIDLLTLGESKVREAIHVECLFEVARRIASGEKQQISVASDATIQNWLIESKGTSGASYSDQFLLNEWIEIVDAWQIRSWDAYRDVSRLGRKTRMAEKQRARIWEVFQPVIARLDRERLVTRAGLFSLATQRIETARHSPFSYVVIDEAQDTGIPEMRFLAAFGVGKAESLFFCGDLGQRIFQTPFSWKSVGIDIRGRSHTLRINYRTSQQIRQCADLLLPTEVSDVDGNSESRTGTVSVFDGPKPSIRVSEDIETEATEVANWIRDRLAEGFAPDEMAIIVRSERQIERAALAAKEAGLVVALPDDEMQQTSRALRICTMHLAKGLEFRGIVVMACDDEIVPLQDRIASVTDDSDLQEVYDTERHLLYVACTRARDQLLITGVNPASEFLDDLYGEV